MHFKHNLFFVFFESVENDQVRTPLKCEIFLAFFDGFPKRSLSKKHERTNI